MLSSFVLLLSSVALAQVPQDVIVVGGDDDQVLGFDTAGAAWTSNPFVDEIRPNSGAALTDIVVDGLDEVYATVDGSMGRWMCTAWTERTAGSAK